MKLSAKSLPIGSLPYSNPQAVVHMMIKLYEKFPYLPELPLLGSNEDVINRTLSRIPGITVNDKRLTLVDDKEVLIKSIEELDKVLNELKPELFDEYKIETAFSEKYLEIIKRVKPEQTVINLLGPFTFAQYISNRNIVTALLDKYTRKFIIQSLSVKAMWAINKIQELSPQTKVLILFEEPLLHQYNNIARMSENINQDTIVSLYSKIFNRIHDMGGYVGVQCFEKCAWQMILDTEVDLISFDAYTNPNNLNIITDKVNEFLQRGGYINWAIVPVKSETTIKQLSIDMLYSKLIGTIGEFINNGGNSKLTYRHSLVSVQGQMSIFPIMFAEKALMMTTQLAKKIPIA